MRFSIRNACAALAGLPLIGGCARPPSLEHAVMARMTKSGAETVGVYFRDLTRPDSLLIDADTRMHAASTMKVPVMIQVFRDADAGKLRLGDSIVVKNEFASIVDGSPYTLDPADDSDSTLYARVGERVSIRDLVELMITVSSNLATNLLIQRVGPERVTASMRELGADSIEVLRGVEDTKAYQAGRSNTTTARDLGIILAAIAERRAASPDACSEMLAVLERQTFNEGIPAGLPAGVRVAHKTGEITRIHHDAAIVSADRGVSYVLVVLVRGIERRADSAKLMADLARLVHAHVTAGR
jgi:beta-lactamase class A